MSKSVYMDLVERNLKLKKEIVEMLTIPKKDATEKELYEAMLAKSNALPEDFANNPEVNLFNQIGNTDFITMNQLLFSAQQNQTEVTENVSTVEEIIKELKKIN